ncbi:aromatic/alkene monooxygenase hydroxylase subunit beta [Tardiphaga sp.]|uniref:aromatic/alkene monooxygenase hydroxylase subunit beta n=1 Tax=Tardiphaga sp. TaxID=1926292 RepID=UPI00352ABF91
MSVELVEAPQKSAAAGAKTFPGSDSRSYNYYEPKGRKATHYEDVTVDVQPDPERYLLQDWIMSFSDGTPTYTKEWTSIKSSDWHKYRAPDQEWERTHYQRQSTICGMVKNVVDNARRARAPTRFDKMWVKILQDHVGAYKHAEYGLGTALMHAQRYGYTQMINNAILTNSSYKLRLAQDLTLYLGEVALDLPEFDLDAGKRNWLENPIWQKARELVESARGAGDFLEQYFIVNVLFEPLVGELFRSGFVMQVSAAQNDYSSPAVISAAEADYERNLANTVEMFALLVRDLEHGEDNRQIIHGWFDKYSPIATQAAMDLQPIWSLPRVKSAQFADAYSSALNRLQAIAAEIGIFSTQVKMPEGNAVEAAE